MAKTSKSGKSSRKIASGGMIAVIVAIILIVIGFFTYISGILPKTLTGVVITENLSDGSTKTVKNFSVLETNFHFKEVFDSYSQYGMVSEDHLDDVYDASTGETYRDWLLREAASQMKTLALVERAAQQSGFADMSKARDISKKNLETLELYSLMYGAPSGTQYLQSIYGTGMTGRNYVEFQSREILVQEYGNYLQQFDPAIVPTDEQVKAKFDEDPNKCYVYDYNSYYIPADKDADGKIVDFDKCVAAADKIAAATTDSASFRQAVMDYLKEKGDEDALADFENDADPTFTEKLSYSGASYMSSDVKAFIFSDNKPGDVKTITTEFGAYVVYIAGRQIDETATVSYRVLNLSTGVKNDSTPEEITAAVDKTVAEASSYCVQGMDPLSFYKVVRDHSTDNDTILNGGFRTGATEESLKPAEGEGQDPAEEEAEAWLFESGRKQGDIKIVVSADNKTVIVYYFEASRPAWENSVRDQIISSNFAQWNIDLESTNPNYTVNAGLARYLIY
jgi:hypothetical protein